MTRIIKMYTGLALVLLIFGNIASQTTSAQQNPCADLSNFLCAKLTRALQNWAEIGGDRVKIKDWKYIGRVDENNRQALFARITDKTSARFPITTPENRVFETVLLAEGIKEYGIKQEEVNKWRESVGDFLGKSEHAVEILWTSAGFSFETISFLSPEYPYIYDNMLSSIVISETSNSCVHQKVLWIWGTVRGEVFIDLVADCSRIKTICLDSSEGGMWIGNVVYRNSAPVLEGNRCTMKAAWAFTTPLANIGFNLQAFKFEISGIGSVRSGSKTCLASCPSSP